MTLPRVIIAGGRRDTEGLIYGYSVRDMWREVVKAMAAAGYHGGYPEPGPNGETICVPPNIGEVVSGGATGVDTLGEEWADCNWIPLKRFPADWKKHGYGAGPIRNREMAVYAAALPEGGALVAIWDGKSKGTKNMIDTANKLGLKVHIHYV